MPKGPYEVVCKCGFKTLVSHSVVHRLLTCNHCKRTTYYERDLKGTTRINTPVGRFQSKKELERRLYARAKANLQYGQASTEDKESSRLRSNKDSDSNKVHRSEDADRSVLRSDKGLHDASIPAHAVSGKVKKARMAK
jgi:hypothetical protein